MELYPIVNSYVAETAFKDRDRTVGDNQVLNGANPTCAVIRTKTNALQHHHNNWRGRRLASVQTAEIMEL